MSTSFVRNQQDPHTVLSGGMAQSAGAAEYTDRVYAEGKDSPQLKFWLQH